MPAAGTTRQRSKARAEAALAPPAQIGLPLTGGDGEYRGPFAYRQGKAHTLFVFDSIAVEKGA